MARGGRRSRSTTTVVGREIPADGNHHPRPCLVGGSHLVAAQRRRRRGGSTPAPPGGGTAGQTLTSSSYGATLTGGPVMTRSTPAKGRTSSPAEPAGPLRVSQSALERRTLTDFTPGTDFWICGRSSRGRPTPVQIRVADGWLQFRADGAGDTQVYVGCRWPDGLELPVPGDHARPRDRQARFQRADWLSTRARRWPPGGQPLVEHPVRGGDRAGRHVVQGGDQERPLLALGPSTST